MTDITIIQDLFKYFAKYPAHDGVLKNFNLSESGYYTGYATFKSEIEGLTEKNLLPDIVDYVFGVDEDMVKRRIEDVNGIYLFVDYGNISSDRVGQAKTQTDTFLVAITVARPFKPQTLDPVETLFLADQTLNLMHKIKEQMRADSQCSPFLKHLTFPNEITPWFARELANSNGWTMLFSLEGIQMI